MYRVVVLFCASRRSVAFSRVLASLLFKKRTRCVATAVRLRVVCALLVFAFRRCVRFDVLGAVCTLFAVCASVFQENASKPASSWSVVVFRHCARVDILRAGALFLLFVPLFFKKCTRTDLFSECRCFSLPFPCLLSRQATSARFFVVGAVF